MVEIPGSPKDLGFHAENISVVTAGGNSPAVRDVLGRPGSKNVSEHYTAARKTGTIK